MPPTQWMLVDVDRDVYVESLSLGPRDLGSPAAHMTKRTLRGGLRDGVDLIEIDNGALRVAVLPQRGMGLWKAWHSDLEIGWQSPNRGPVHPRFVPLAEPSGLGWLDGFDELLCRCGLVSNGAPEFDANGKLLYPLHGQIANRPAHRVTLSVGSDGELTLVGEVDESRFHFHHLRLTSTLRMQPGEPTVSIVDEITNLSGRPGEAQLLYHLNVGPPLLGPGAALVAAVEKLMPRTPLAAQHLGEWDRYAAPQADAQEQVYFMQPAADATGHAEVLLKNPEATRGLSLRFNRQQLPLFALWKNTPAYQDGYVTGLEPTVNFPNPRSYEKKHGRLLALAPGETRRFELSLTVHADAQSVAAVESAIRKLQSQVQPEILSKPAEPWVMP